MMPEDDASIEIVWLASYPKSGNTWLRFFLTCLLQGRPESSAAVHHCIPEIGSGRDHEIKGHHGLTLVKTHYLYSPKIPFIPQTKGFIYIVRNPLDLMLSTYNYHLLHLGEEMKVPEERYLVNYLRHYLSEGGEERWLKLNYGTWMQHLQSWTGPGAAKHPHLILRYEDMLATPYLVACSLCAFLGLDKSDREIEEALEFSSFKNMKAMEEKEIQSEEDTLFKREVAGLGHQRGKRFMNRGKANLKHLIPPVIRQQAQQLYQEPMRRFGYL